MGDVEEACKNCEVLGRKKYSNDTDCGISSWFAEALAHHPL